MRNSFLPNNILKLLEVKEKNKIEQVVIVGGGKAGWISSE